MSAGAEATAAARAAAAAGAAAPPADGAAAAEAAGRGAPLVGRRVGRVEDARLTTGRGRYLDDLTPPGTLHARVVRSQLARGRIASIAFDPDAPPPAGALLATGADVPDGLVAEIEHESWQRSTQPILARDVVRYAGEPVAVVLHPDPYVAEDAAESVVVECEEQEGGPVIALEQALRADAPRVHDGWRDNLYMRRRRTFGDLDGARGRATRVVRRAYRLNRQAGVPLENRGALAQPDPSRRSLTLWSSTQVPHLLRTAVADRLAIPEHSVRVVAPDVGGGFGVKGQVFPEELMVAALALRLGVPVKWVEDRSEHLVASIHARDSLQLVEAHVDDDGRIHALRVQLLVDAGAYSVYPWTAGSDSGMAAKVLPGPYAFDAYEVEDMAVATNKCPLGTYRGVGRPAAVFAMERIVDDVARELGLDPLDVRRRNVVRSFPHTTPTGLEYDPGSYAESIERCADALAGERERRGRGGDGRLRGVGFALYNEQASHGTHDFHTRRTPIETGYVSATVAMDPHGDVTVATGQQSHGQGMETTLAQVAADALGLPLARVRVIHGDTATSPYTVGTWGSRGAALGGGAVREAAAEIGAKLVAIAAHHLDADPGEIELADGAARVRGSAERAIAIATLAYWANRRVGMLPPGMTPALHATGVVDGPGHGAFSNACHGVALAVDPATGGVEIERYVVVEDCGTMLNPMIVDGQVHGGVAQGIGTALLEECVYSPDGQPLTATFMDYLMPSSTDVPAIEVIHLETPSPLTPFGAKGMGESGAIGPPAAIANAVGDALGRAVSETPLRMERVWRAARSEDPPDAAWRRWSAHGALASFWTAAVAAGGGNASERTAPERRRARARRDRA